MPAQYGKRGNGAPAGSNRGAPGRKGVGYERRFREAFNKNVSQAAWNRIIKMAVTQAEHGDKDARKWLSDNLVGTPIQRMKEETEVNQYAGMSDDRLMEIAKKLVQANVIPPTGSI